MKSIIELQDNAFHYQTGYKVDAIIKENLPELLWNRAVPFAKTMEGCPIMCEHMKLWGKDEIEFDEERVMVSIGKYSCIRYECYAYVKGGAMMGEDTGKLTGFTFEEMNKANDVMESNLGTEVDILEPGSYSQLLCTEVQNGFK